MFEVLNPGYSIQICKVRFELPLEDFPDSPYETFRGFLIGNTHVIYHSNRELFVVKVKPNGHGYIFTADGPSTSIGRMQQGDRFQAFVYDLVHRLQNVDGWVLLTKLIANESELKITEVM
jgi:hypothetical protein